MIQCGNKHIWMLWQNKRLNKVFMPCWKYDHPEEGTSSQPIFAQMIRPQAFNLAINANETLNRIYVLPETDKGCVSRKTINVHLIDTFFHIFPVFF